MRTMTRKIGLVLGAALAAILLFGLGKSWAHNENNHDAGAPQQTISKDSQLASVPTTPDDSAKNWRRGRRGRR